MAPPCLLQFFVRVKVRLLGSNIDLNVAIQLPSRFHNGRDYAHCKKNYIAIKVCRVKLCQQILVENCLFRYNRKTVRRSKSRSKNLLQPYQVFDRDIL